MAAPSGIAGASGAERGSRRKTRREHCPIRHDGSTAVAGSATPEKGAKGRFSTECGIPSAKARAETPKRGLGERVQRFQAGRPAVAAELAAHNALVGDP